MLICYTSRLFCLLPLKSHTGCYVTVVWFSVKMKAGVMKGLRCGSIAQSLCKKGSWLNPETPQNLPQEATNQKD